MSTLSRILESDLFYRFSRDKVAMGSAFVVLLFFALALLAPVIAPQNPYDLTQLDILDSEIPPSWQDGGDERFLLGTDHQGRDMLSTILYGTGISLLIGIFAVMLQAVLGITIGLVSGYIGGRIDAFFMRLADLLFRWISVWTGSGEANAARRRHADFYRRQRLTAWQSRFRGI